MQVGVLGPAVWVRVQGRGSFRNSAGLKEFAAEMTGRGHREFVVDLKDCELMDSTFLGTLAGIALKLRPAGHLRVVRANERCRALMRNLGLDRVFTVDGPAPEAPPATALEDADRTPHATGRETIIEAHENLVQADPGNAVRFKDVLDFLRHREPEAQGRP